MSNFTPNILYEDNHMIAINKPAGYLVQGDKTGDAPLSELVKLYLKKKYKKPGNVYLGVCHRLDRPVSGVLVFAKTSKALTRLNQLFKDKKIQKTYWAVTKQQPKEPIGTLSQYLLKNQQRNKSYITSANRKGSKKAVLSYRLIASGDYYRLLEVLPQSGRHHQIRVQLASMGCVIKGDLKYGAARSNRDASIHLHARQISFVHPVKKEPLTIVAPVPEEILWQAFERMVAGA